MILRNSTGFKTIKQTSKAFVYLLLILTCVIWGGAFPAIKYLLKFLTPLQLVKIRFTSVLPFFLFIILIRDKRPAGEMLRRYYGSLTLAAFFGVIGYNMALAMGEVRIPAGIASLIINLSPIFTLLLSVLFLKERSTYGKLIGMLISMVGLFILVRLSAGQNGEMGYYLYAIITLLAPISWAIYTVACKSLSGRFDAFTVTAMPIILGTIPLIPSFGKSDIIAISHMSFRAWLALLFLSCLCTCAGNTVWIWALRRLPSSKVASFIYLIPVSSLMTSYLFLGEPITPVIILGALLLLSGVYIVNKGRAEG